MQRFALLLTLLTPFWAVSATLHGTVIGISDGDTITVLDAAKTQYKVRLSGIDAPEKRQPFGEASKQALSDKVFNRTVTVDYRKQDRYGRIVGKVTFEGVDANLEQIKAGLAWHYKAYEREQPFGERQKYARAEIKARDAGMGLWHEGLAIPPWDWRKAPAK